MVAGAVRGEGWIKGKRNAAGNGGDDGEAEGQVVGKSVVITPIRTMEQDVAN